MKHESMLRYRSVRKALFVFPLVKYMTVQDGNWVIVARPGADEKFRVVHQSLFQL
jgi:hypothetical protein